MKEKWADIKLFWYFFAAATYKPPNEQILLTQ